MRVLATLALALAAGCGFDPPFGEGEIACGPAAACPPGYHCADDARCYRQLVGGDGGDLEAAPADLATVPDDGLAASDPPASCGAPGQVCCAGGGCSGAACCDGAACVASGDDVATASVCLAATITACGAAGLPCCADNACTGGGCCSGGVCAAPGTACIGGGTCASGSCGGCGGAGKPCCKGDVNGGASNDYCTQAGTACDPASSMCKACGAPGLLCCEGNRCDAGGCCDHTNTVAGGCVSAGSLVGDGSVCADGHGGSGACGGAAQPVCGVKVGCTDGLTRDASGVCVPCGLPGQRCCPGAKRGFCAAPFACNGNTGLCAACGDDGEPCCAEGQCPNSAQKTCMGGFCH